MQELPELAFNLAASLIPAKANEPKVPEGLFGEQALSGKNAELNDNLDANIAKWAGV